MVPLFHGVGHTQAAQGDVHVHAHGLLEFRRLALGDVGTHSLQQCSSAPGSGGGSVPGGHGVSSESPGSAGSANRGMVHGRGE